LPVDLDQVSPLYLDMLVGYEDRRFYVHPGIDPIALVRAGWQFVLHGRVVSGASTISMQTVRLLDQGGERSLVEKLRQMRSAIALERRYGKSGILKLYLRLAPFGGNLEGVRAASLAYFGKEPKHLTAGEAALLVALPQAPGRRPDRRPEAARAGRDRVLDRMVRSGILSREHAAAARREPVPVARRPMAALAPHLTAAFHHQAKVTGPVHTTINGVLQREIERRVAAYRGALDPAANLAAIVVRNSDRAVIAHIGSTDVADAARAGAFDFSRAIRSPGSTIKPFIYGLAFETLLVHPDTLVDDSQVRYGRYAPSNFEPGFGGPVSVHDALLRSLNTTAVAILDALGPQRLLARLRAAGTPLRLPQLDADAGLAVAVGGCGISLTDLVTLYAALPNRGLLQPLRYMPDEPTAAAYPLLSPEASWAVANILADMRPPDGPAATQIGGRRRVAYKTGTSAGLRDAWAIGFDADHTVGVWTGRPDAAAMVGHVGRSTAAPLLFRIFDLLPYPVADPAGPPLEGSVLTTRGNLPTRLVRFTPSSSPERPIIDMPFDGAELTGAQRGVNLRAHGGRPPYRWLVDGDPLGPASTDAERVWHPSVSGAIRLEVVDGSGQSDSINIWLGAASR
jgi:penicillin-binding protein 1C